MRCADAKPHSIEATYGHAQSSIRCDAYNGGMWFYVVCLWYVSSTPKTHMQHSLATANKYHGIYLNVFLCDVCFEHSSLFDSIAARLFPREILANTSSHIRDGYTPYTTWVNSKIEKIAIGKLMLGLGNDPPLKAYERAAWCAILCA